ncbi:MAG: transketolase family protein [Firmicutes bacterium]|nr:transketolase family protein [Bacillota bacterium]
MTHTPQMVPTRAAYGKALIELGRLNPDIVVLDADLSKSTRTDGFAREFPERFFQMGVAEADMMGTAAGLAASGKIPFASSFAIFASGRAFDQVRQTAGYGRLNVKIGASHGGITVGEDGASHQSIEDLTLMRVIPGMTVIVPADAVETHQAVFAAADHEGPVYIRTGRSPVPVLFKESYNFKIGEAIVVRDGKDITIIACGIMVSESLKAAEILAEKGISARVINMATIKPIHTDIIIKAAEETGAIVTAEEHSIIGGLGSAVCETVSEICPVPVKRIGVCDVFGQSGKPDELMKAYSLTADDIARTALEVIKRKEM